MTNELTQADKELLEYADSRMLKYPGVVNSDEPFESEETSDWDKAYNLAMHIKERGYPAPEVETHALANHILEQWKKLREKEKPKEKGAFEE